MGILGKLFAPEREKKIKFVREITEGETYNAFMMDGNFTEQESREEARKMGKKIDRQLRRR